MRHNVVLERIVGRWDTSGEWQDIDEFSGNDGYRGPLTWTTKKYLGTYICSSLQIWWKHLLSYELSGPRLQLHFLPAIDNKYKWQVLWFYDRIANPLLVGVLSLEIEEQLFCIPVEQRGQILRRNVGLSVDRKPLSGYSTCCYIEMDKSQILLFIRVSSSIGWDPEWYVRINILRERKITQTHTLMEDIASSPCGLAVNRNEDIAMAAKRVIIHDDRKADTLLTLEKTLCMMVYGWEKRERLLRDTSSSRFDTIDTTTRHYLYMLRFVDDGPYVMTYGGPPFE